MQGPQPEEGNSRYQSWRVCQHEPTRPPKEGLAELEEKVRTTKELIQAEETSIANSKQETQEIAEQIQEEFAEISTLSWQIVTGDNKDDEAIIARADAVRTEASHAIEEFLNQ